MLVEQRADALVGIAWCEVPKENPVEEWRVIVEYPKYEVSSKGRVRHARLGKLRSQHLSGAGYPMVSLRVGGKGTQGTRVYVHRLVAAAFLGPCPAEGFEVNHKDGDKTNAALANLEWVSRSENAAHAYRTGLKRRRSGEELGTAKLTEEQVREARYMRSRGATREVVARRFGVAPTTIQALDEGRTYRGVT